jgi:hypothetical protein
MLLFEGDAIRICCEVGYTKMSDHVVRLEDNHNDMQ